MGWQQLLLVLLFTTTTYSGKIRHGIIGGREAKPHSWPYIVHLKIGRLFCGGSLIAPDWVLSAAHCYGLITAILGAHDVSQPEQSQQIFGIESYHVHPEYDEGAALPFNDVMLLKLSAKATLNKYVQTIPLTSSSSDIPTNTPCSIAGWGLIDENHSTEKLFETNITIINRKYCRRFFPRLSDGMICAGSSNQMRDTSQGDSGGPMVCRGVLEGITSFGFDHPPGVYARVGKYLDWIKKTMSEYGDGSI